MDDSKDDEATKKERKGYRYTGFGTGPDTTMGVLWGSVLILVASRDATCHPHNGRSSGMDGQSCTATDFWNETFFHEVGGDACLGSNILGDSIYMHDDSSAPCMAAFASYRGIPAYTGDAAFTCNCTGQSNDHAFLGAGGLRPSTVYNLMLTVALILNGFLGMFVGTFADFSSKKLRNWLRLCYLGGICNLGMMALGGNGIWIIGMIFGGLTLIFTEIQIPLRSSYLEVIAKNDATRGYVGAMRQFASYSAQVVYVAVAVGFQSFVSDDQVQGMFLAGVCAVWFLISMPLILRMMREHPAQRSAEGKNPCVLTITEICKQWAQLRKYPEAVKFLIAHMFANFGGPLFVTLVSTYVPSQLNRSGIMMSAIAAVVLVVGMPATLLLANMMKRNVVSFKVIWAIVLVLNILIGVLVPVVARDTSFISYLLMLALPGMIGAVSVSWFYSIGWASFITLVPEAEVGAYNGIFNFVNTEIQPFGTLIYFAIVQGTNSHPLAWALSTTPFCALSLVIMMTVNFQKGKADVARTIEIKSATSESASSAA